MSPEAYLDEQALASNDLLRDVRELLVVINRLEYFEIAAYKQSTIYCQELIAGLVLYEVLFTPGYLDDDVRNQLWIALDKLPDWDVTETTTNTRTFAEQRLDKNPAVICFGFFAFEGTLRAPRLKLAGSPSAVSKFFLEVPELLNYSESQYIRCCAKSLSRLIFVEDIDTQLRRFSSGYPGVRKTLTAALSDLNTHLAALLDAATVPQEIEARFEALSTFMLSPESANTKKNARAMREREVLHDGHKVWCEWHVKLQPTRDRIHIHFFDPRIGDGRQILIGIFAEHLST